MIKINKNIIYIGLLIFIAVISHLQWFNFNSVLTSGDWQFRYTELIKGFFGGWNSWISFDNFGSTNIQLFAFPLRGLVWPILVNFGFSYDLAVKISILFIVSLGGFLFPYFYIKRLTKDNYIAFVSSLCYASAIYFLIIETRHLFIAIIFCILPLIIYLFDEALENNRLIDWLIFSLFFTVGCVYELRIMYIVSFILLFYIIFFGFKKIKKYFMGLLLSIGIFVSLSLYWILPLFFTGNSSISDIVSRDLFGNNLFNLKQAFTIFRWSWTGGFEDRSFIVQPIQWYLWLVPLISYISLLFRNKYKKNIIFFLILSLVGLFITKQSAEPFGELYLWFYRNFPGFSLFREASKFYLITAFSYLGLISYTLLYLRENKNLKYLYYFFSVVLIMVSLTNLKPLITTEIGGIFVNRSEQIPEDYKIFKNYVHGQNNYFKIGWVPLPVSWGYYSDLNPRVTFTEFQSTKFDYLRTKDTSILTLPVLTPFIDPMFKEVFELLSIKYFILPIREIGNYSNVFESYGEKNNPKIREYYKSFLDNVDYLKQIDIGTKDLIVYQNKEYKEPIFLFSELINFDSLQNLESKYNFTQKLNDDFYFVTRPKNIFKEHLTRINNIFENSNLDNGIIVDSVENLDKNIKLYKNLNISNLNKYLFLNNQKISHGFITMNKGVNKFEYKNPDYNFNNIILNPSFETGLWQEKVGDCHNFDKNPILNMSLNKEEKSDGEQSLQLEATRHNACTKISLSVVPGGLYLFSFGYQSPNSDHASYYLGFNDKDKTVIKDDLKTKDKNWNTFSKTIKVPEGATTVSLYVYADSTDEKTNIINRYDNFKMIQVPDLTNAYYLVSEPEEKLVEPKSISFDLINPTKKLVHIKGATTPFFLAMSESYHDKWQLQFNNNKINGFFDSWVPFVKPDKIEDEYHYKLNDFLNAWYVDTNEYCTNNNLCIKNADGSYDIEMTIEFFPQRWFYLGLLISGTTLVGCLGYLGYEGVKRIKIKIKKKDEKDN